MRWRWVSIFLLVQQAVWLLVLLPGHRRGAMVVAGWEPANGSAGGGGCCTKVTPATTSASCHAPTAVPGGDGAVPEGAVPGKDDADRASRCAVCHIAVRMMVAAPVDLSLPPLALMEVLPPDRPSERPSLQISPTYLACGPPAA